MVTAENEMKWDATEPIAGPFNFGPADQIVKRASGNGNGCAVTPWSGTPSCPAGCPGSVTRTTLRNAMNNHITGVMTHYKGKIYAWDVVNEAFADGAAAPAQLGLPERAAATAASRRPSGPPAPPTRPRSSATTTTTSRTGPTPRPRASTTWSRTSRPAACRSTASASSPTSAPAGSPATSRPPWPTSPPSASTCSSPSWTSQDASPTAYANTVKACLNVARCTGITVWGVRDSDSWRTGANPLLFDGNGNKKAAYDAVVAALGTGTPIPTGTPTPTGTPIPTSAPTTQTTPSPSGDPGQAGVCSATYQRIAGWGGGFLGTVTVTNPGSTPITGWTVQLGLAAKQSLVFVWNGKATGTSGTVKVANASYNATIEARGTQVFGLLVTGSETPAPTVVGCTAAGASPSPSSTPTAQANPSTSAPTGGAGGSLPSSFKWSDQGALIAPKTAPGHDVISVKDPTIVRHNGEYLVYASTVSDSRLWSLAYTHFGDFAKASQAPAVPPERQPEHRQRVSRSAAGVLLRAEEDVVPGLPGGSAGLLDDDRPDQAGDLAAPTNFLAAGTSSRMW